MFFRGRGLIFWLVVLTSFYLIVTEPVSFADFTADTWHTLLRVLRSMRDFFDALRH
ncbi:hypothetical protein ACFVOK_14295 [Streptomyces sp. NPDC057798]|uniref:hypothetical protein n=1 Tax=Streptomyces sp. NPDC057798 TaxID=3346252 RepID=UPI0036944B7E